MSKHDLPPEKTPDGANDTSADVTSSGDEQLPTLSLPAIATTPPAPLGAAPSELAPWQKEVEDGDDEWAVQAGPSRLRLRIPTAILLGLLIAAGAFWGGAAAQRSQGGTTAGFGAAASRLRGLLGAAGATGASGIASLFGGGASAAATGTLTVINGSTLYLTNSAGDIVKVLLSPSATVTRDASTSVSALQPGDTVVAQGVTAKDGTVTATSVAATGPGVSAGGGAGRFGGGGGG